MVTTINAQTSSSLDLKAAVDGTPLFGNSISTPSSLTPGPLVARGDAYVVLQGHTLTIPVSAGVLANDDNASSAVLANSGTGSGDLQFASDGSFTYTSWKGFSGVDGFVYDANGSSSAESFVRIYVVPVSAGETTTLNLLGLTAQQQIASTYAAFFGRGPDADGFEFWVDQFQAGLPSQGPGKLFANIASSFGISAEAQALYPFLANPFGATDASIGAFLDSVYNNLFNRTSDAAGLAYWTNQIKQTLEAGQFVGSVLVSIIGGAQDTAAGKDITTLMGKVAVALEYVQAQELHGTQWAGNSDRIAATQLLDPVTSDPLTVVIGVKNADALVEAHG